MKLLSWNHPSKHSSWWRGTEDVFKTSSSCLQDIIARRLTNTSWRRLEDVLGRRIANTSWRRLEDVLKRSWKTKSVTLKTSWKTRNVWWDSTEVRQWILLLTTILDISVNHISKAFSPKSTRSELWANIILYT